MPTTPKMFSALYNTAAGLSMPADRPAGSRLGFMLAGLVDRLAPEGYEDEAGFHAEEMLPADSRRLTAEASCHGEQI